MANTNNVQQIAGQAPLRGIDRAVSRPQPAWLAKLLMQPTKPTNAIPSTAGQGTPLTVPVIPARNGIQDMTPQMRERVQQRKQQMQQQTGIANPKTAEARSAARLASLQKCAAADRSARRLEALKKCAAADRSAARRSTLMKSASFGDSIVQFAERVGTPAMRESDGAILGGLGLGAGGAALGGLGGAVTGAVAATAPGNKNKRARTLLRHILLGVLGGGAIGGAAGAGLGSVGVAVDKASRSNHGIA